MAWFFDHYLVEPADNENPLVAPLLLEELSGQPAALIITAEFDPLRDEGEEYAVRLKEAGVPVVLRRYRGTIHGFVSLLPPMKLAETAIGEIADFLQNIWAGRAPAAAAH
jgi:acetyl esterase